MYTPLRLPELHVMRDSVWKEVVRITEKARDNTNTIGLATSPGTLPGNDKPFEMRT